MREIFVVVHWEGPNGPKHDGMTFDRYPSNYEIELSLRFSSYHVYYSTVEKRYVI